jgi:hypothetical protein
MKRVLLLVALVALVAVVSNAQIGLKGIGGEVGYNSFSFSSESFGGFVVGAVADLGEVSPGIALYPSVTYASASKTLTGGDWKVSDLAINANVKYAFKGGNITPYVGAGLGINFVSTTVQISYFGFSGSATGSDTKFGINLLAGAQMPVGTMTGFVQAGYSLVSDVNFFQVVAGVMVPLH